MKDDQEFVRLNTNAMTWEQSASGDYDVKRLADRSFETVSVIRIHSGTIIDKFGHKEGSELLVLEGDLSGDEVDMPEGTWLRNPPGYFHRLNCKREAIAYLKTGHLCAGHLVSIP